MRYRLSLMLKNGREKLVMKQLKKAAFLGLGVMGHPMAGHLATKTDLEITVYNRTSEKADIWLSQYTGQKADTPAEAAKEADIIFICVGNDNDLRHILTGPDGAINTIQEGAVIMDHTTVSAAIAREMTALFTEKGACFLDAPVSGGQSGAENGQLTIMAGGSQTAFDHVAPLIRQTYAREMRYMGPSGSGQLTKMVNQICIAGLLQGLSEGLAFGKKAGLNIEDVLSVIGKGAAQSWQMDNRGQTMMKDDFNFGFAVDWMVKDLKIALEEAQKNGASLEETARILGYYEELQKNGEGRMDTSALIRRLGSVRNSVSFR